VEALFRSLSRLRGRRIFHPFGVGFRGSLEPLGQGTGAAALDAEAEALVRLSRSFGLPERFPDPCGLAFRLPDAYGPGRHQDLLLVSSGAAPGARHALLPSRGFCDRPYSAVLPYRLRGKAVMLGARALAPAPGPGLADLRRRDVAGLDFELQIAPPRGSWRSIARLRLGERMKAEETERLDLDPTNSGGGLEPAGLLNRLRGPTYRASQEGREAAYKKDQSGTN
jgi:hypothetical protein